MTALLMTIAILITAVVIGLAFDKPLHKEIETFIVEVE